VSGALGRWWGRQRLRDPTFAPLFEPPPAERWVAIDTETTGLDVRTDELLAIAAIPIEGNRVLARERLELCVRPTRPVDERSIRIHHLRDQDVADGLPAAEAVARLLEFVGPRPLVGYYLEFDVAMIERVARPMLGGPLPNERHEVSALYYARASRHRHALELTPVVDLRFETIMTALGVPPLPAHDATADALRAAIAFVMLRGG
jgi:DNA polymerase-3 subunit epsilon